MTRRMTLQAAVNIRAQDQAEERLDDEVISERVAAYYDTPQGEAEARAEEAARGEEDVFGAAEEVASQVHDVDEPTEITYTNCKAYTDPINPGHTIIPGKVSTEAERRQREQERQVRQVVDNLDECKELLRILISDKNLIEPKFKSAIKAWKQCDSARDEVNDNLFQGQLDI